MSWLRLDDDFYDHEKLGDLDPAAGWLWVRALGWSAKHLRDGFVPAHVVVQFAGGIEAAQHLAALLVKARLWVVASGGWSAHDFTEYNPSAEQVRAKRAEAKARMAARRAQGGSVRANKGGGSQEPAENVLANSARTDHERADEQRANVPKGDPRRSLPPSRPDPTRPVSPTGDTPPTPSPGVGAGEGGAPRAPTVERQGFRADAFAALLRERAKGRVLAAGADGRVLVQLQRAMDDATRAGATRASYETLADWYAAGSQAWRTTRPLGLAELATKPGELSEHLERAAAWDAAGRPVIAHPSRAPATPAPRRVRVGPAAPSTFGARDYDAEREALIRDAEGSL